MAYSSAMPLYMAGFLNQFLNNVGTIIIYFLLLPYQGTLYKGVVIETWKRAYLIGNWNG